MGSAHSPQRNEAAQEILEPAWRMRWRAPELALLLSDRAVADARCAGDRALRLRAESLALFASCRLGKGVVSTERAITAVRDAETAGDEEITAELRVGLAGCARQSRSNDVALRILHPVLQLQRVQPEVRADALVEFAEALPMQCKTSECDEALNEAERLYKAATELGRDTIRLLLAQVAVARACHFRRRSEFRAAADATEAGLGCLDRLADPAADSGELRARLVLERVHALLELGQRTAAVEAATGVLRQPVRASFAAPAGWLRVALATRVHMPEGESDVAARLLNDVVAEAERHELGNLKAEAMSTLSHVHEREEDFAGALRCLRGAYAADRRWRLSVHNARIRLLKEFPSGTVKPPLRRATVESQPAQRQAVPPSPEISLPRQEEAQSRPEVVTPRQEHPPQREVPAEQLPQPEPAPESRAHAEPDLAEQVAGDGNVRDAARRLMDTLTKRATEERSKKPSLSVEDLEDRFSRADNSRHETPEATAEPPTATRHDAPTTAAQQAAADAGHGPVGGRRRRRAEEEILDPFMGLSPGEKSAPEPHRFPDNAAELGWRQNGERPASVERVEDRWPNDDPPFAAHRRFAATNQAAAETPWPAQDDESRPEVTTIMPVIGGGVPDVPSAPQWPEPQYEQPRFADTPDYGSADAGQDEPGGRRSRGKSLAEIRAGLQLVDGDAGAGAPSGGRRARHAEPDEPATSEDAWTSRQQGVNHGDDFLEQNRKLLDRLPQISMGAPVPDEPDEPDELPAKKNEEPGPPAANAGLADLLTEALMAYENGRREGPGSWESTRDADVAAAPARHRRAVGDSIGEQPRQWTLPSY